MIAVLPDIHVLINDQPLADVPTLAEWQAVTITCTPVVGATNVRLRIGAHDLGPPVITLGDPHWRWTWNPENTTGTFRAALQIDAAVVPFTLEVVPSKLSQQHYDRLLQAIEQTALDLLLAWGGGEIVAGSGKDNSPASLVARWPHLHALATQAVYVASALARQPHHTQRHAIHTVPLHELHTLDHTALESMGSASFDDVANEHVPSLQAAFRSPDQARGGPLPQRLRTTTQHATTDCIEHRVLRTVLDRLALQVAAVGTVLHDERQRARLGLSAEQLGNWQQAHKEVVRQLRRVRTLPFLVDIPTTTHCSAPTHLMRHHPHYRQVYRLWQALRSAPQLDIEQLRFMLPLAPLPLLYEQWCVLATAQALAQLGVIVQQQLLIQRADERHVWDIRLRENAPLVVVQLSDERTATLFYHRRYDAQRGHGATLGSLDPFTRIPDLALEVQRPDAAPQTLLLDAKYRVTGDGTLPQTALDTAYTYRGAIGYNGTRATLGAWLLFPGTTPITAGDVGALPLLPNEVRGLDELLRRVLCLD